MIMNKNISLCFVALLAFQIALSGTFASAQAGDNSQGLDKVVHKLVAHFNLLSSKDAVDDITLACRSHFQKNGIVKNACHLLSTKPLVDVFQPKNLGFFKQLMWNILGPDIETNETVARLMQAQEAAGAKCELEQINTHFNKYSGSGPWSGPGAVVAKVSKCELSFKCSASLCEVK